MIDTVCYKSIELQIDEKINVRKIISFTYMYESNNINKNIVKLNSKVFKELLSPLKGLLFDQV